MKLLISMMMCTGALVAGPVLADEQQVPPRGTLEELQQKCQDLLGNQQLKPFNVQITCRASGFNWRAGVATQSSVQGQREIGGSVLLKDMEIPYSGRDVAIDAIAFECPTFEKWSYLVAAVDVQLTCEELAGITDVTDYCAPVIAQRVAEDPTLAVEENTGEVKRVCIDETPLPEPEPQPEPLPLP